MGRMLWAECTATGASSLSIRLKEKAKEKEKGIEQVQQLVRLLNPLTLPETARLRRKRGQKVSRPTGIEPDVGVEPTTLR